MPLTNTKLSRPLWAALLLTSAAACGPESRDSSEWMYHTFSSNQEHIGQTYPFTAGLYKFSFSVDGEGTRTVLNSCGDSPEKSAFSWESLDDDVVVIAEGAWLADGGSISVTRVDDCSPNGWEQIEMVEMAAGVEVSRLRMTRGDVCFEQFDCGIEPGNSQCDNCRTVWCDEPAASCSND